MNYRPMQLTLLSIWLKRKDKRAWMKILEAFIAIMMLLGFVLAIMVKQMPKSTASEEMYNLEKQLLEDIAANASLRSAVIRHDVVPLKIFVYGRLPPYFDYDILICSIFQQNCQLAKDPGKDVYANDILISSALTELPTDPLMVRIFLWPGKPSLPPEMPPIEPPVEPPAETIISCLADGGGASFNFIFTDVSCKPPVSGSCTNTFYVSLTAPTIFFSDSFYKQYCSEGATDCTFTGCTAISTYLPVGKDVTNPGINAEKFVCLKKSDGTQCKMKIKRTA